MSATTAPATTFSARLREATALEHRQAEDSALLGELTRGELGLGAWLVLLEQYRAVYGALEEGAGRMPENRPVQALLSVELNRVPSIDADLAALRERTGRAPIGMLPSAREYAERILAASNSVPRYIAHHYTRYLGDLSGGQAIRVWLDRAYGLPEQQAAFFRFDGIPRPPAFKAAYRAALDALELDERQERDAFEEARTAFLCNRQLFDEVHEVVRAQPLAAS